MVLSPSSIISIINEIAVKHTYRSSENSIHFAVAIRKGEEKVCCKQ